MSRIGGIVLVAPLLVGHLSSRAVLAQAPERAECSVVLTQPTRDSLPLRMGLTVRAFDRERELPLMYQADFGEAVRRHLILPRPLGADVYVFSGDTTGAPMAHLTFWGNYAGTITELAATGGAQLPFAQPVLDALPRAGYSPLEVDGCHVRSIVVHAFGFHVRR
jgi:hypothetical protein